LSARLGVPCTAAELIHEDACVLAVIDRLQKKEMSLGADEAKFVRNGNAEIQIWLTDKSDETLVKLKELGFEVMLDPKSAASGPVELLALMNGQLANSKGQLAANKVTFTPDEFAVEVAEEQQIMANKAAASQAQTTANQGVKEAKLAQSSADKAQASANKAGNEAQAAGTVAVMDAEAIQMVNKRVSDLGDYKLVGEAGIYFPVDGSTLDDAAKADLDTLAAYTKGLEGYLIEIAGYASATGTKQLNQKLSGHYSYYGITGNWNALSCFALAVRRAWRFWLDRRSQRARMKWARFNQLLRRHPLAPPRAVHSVLARPAKP